MKKWITILTVAAVMTAWLPASRAGDREWATAGKVLAGVIAGAAIVQALQPPPPCAPAPPVVCAPAPPAVVVAPPAPPPVVYVPAPVVVAPAPVVCGPPPFVGCRPAVHLRPAPVVAVRFAFTPGHPHRHWHGR